MLRLIILTVALLSGANAIAKLPVGTFSIDNDLFALRGSDRDYTGGVRYTSPEKQSRSWQAGMLLFTPDRIEANMYRRGERPYASLIYFGSSQTSSVSEDVLYRRTWSVGLLGSKLGEAAQRFVHKHTDSPQPRGYDDQISNGGELTGRIGLTRYQHLSGSWTRKGYLNIVSESSVSAGYFTDASFGVGFRLRTRGYNWWGESRNDFLSHFDEPEVSNNFEGIFGGVRMRVRAYNALLQGQFRHSEVTFSPGELKHVVGEAWIGAATMYHGWQVRSTIRYSSAEVKSGLASRPQVWGSIVFQKRF